MLKAKVGLSAKPYEGPLTKGRMPRNVQRAHWIWLEQRRRCANPKHRRYRTYGGQGVRVEYAARDFIGWYLDAVREHSFPMHVGRIDHSKSYCFDNIELQTPSENAKEVHARAAPTAKLTALQVEAIRQELETEKRGDLTRLAQQYGVSVAAIYHIKAGATWRSSRKHF